MNNATSLPHLKDNFLSKSIQEVTYNLKYDIRLIKIMMNYYDECKFALPSYPALKISRIQKKLFFSISLMVEMMLM